METVIDSFVYVIGIYAGIIALFALMLYFLSK